MNAVRYFLAAMGVLFVVLSIVFGIVGNLRDESDAMVSIMFLTFGGFFLFGERIIAATPKPEHQPEE